MLGPAVRADAIEAEFMIDRCIAVGGRNPLIDVINRTNSWEFDDRAATPADQIFQPLPRRVQDKIAVAVLQVDQSDQIDSGKEHQRPIDRRFGEVVVQML